MYWIRSCIFALAFAALALTSCGEGAGDARIGSVAPAFALPELRGAEISLSQLRGRIVIIDFWATWCPPCLFQIPILNAIRETHPADEVFVLGIAVDVEGARVVAPYVEENGIDYPVLLGDEDLALRFGAPGFPYLVVLGPEGKLAYRHAGVVGLRDLQQQISALRDGDH